MFAPGGHEFLYLSLVAYIAETFLRFENSAKILRHFEAYESRSWFTIDTPEIIQESHNFIVRHFAATLKILS